jgi:nucleoid DNA-binding protein
MSKHRPNRKKIELVAIVARVTGARQAVCLEVINQFLEAIADTLRDGKTIELRKFGTFAAKDRKARPALNPRTLEKCIVPARIVPVFKASPELKKAVNP